MENHEAKAEIESQALLLQFEDRTIEVQDRTKEIAKDTNKSKNSIFVKLRAKIELRDVRSHARTAEIVSLKADLQNIKNDFSHVQKCSTKPFLHAMSTDYEVLSNASPSELVSEN